MDLTYIVHLNSTTLDKHLNTWCDACALPSGYDVTFGVELEGKPLEVLRLTGCAECGPA